MRVLSTVKFTALRMIRNYIVLLLLLLVPIIILTIFSFILSGVVTEMGEPSLHVTALTMVLTFQLFGGSIVMYMIHNDLITANKMRMYALPFNQTMYAFSIMTCGAIFSITLGILLMLYTQFVLGVVWGNWLWTIYIISLLAILSIIVSLILTFSVKSYKIAEQLNTLYGVGFVILAGLFFPMPKNSFFDFMGSYGNPLSLSIGAVYDMNLSDKGEAWLQANALLLAVGILFVWMLVMGRRKLK